MISILSASHYLQALHDDTALPSLDAALKNLCREPFRRIDRFIQLALLGSARCAVAQSLQPDCAIYLGSGLGPIDNNIVTQQQLIRDKQIPKPFNFVNTLGSSAGFYVARNLGLSGQNFFIARSGANLEAVLSVAWADMALAVCSQALVGVVEEISLPLREHRVREQLPENAPLAESSYWFLLQANAAGKRSLDMRRFTEFEELRSCLAGIYGVGGQLLCGRGMDRHAAASLCDEYDNCRLPDSNGAFQDGPNTARVAEFAAGSAPGNLFLVNGDTSRGWVLFHFSA